MKKALQLQNVTDLAIEHMESREIRAEIQPVDEAEIEEMWNFVEKKSQPRWLWHTLIIELT